MSTREIVLKAALKVLQEDGEAKFSTRAVCAIARVTAPTLYHHFGNADGLLSAAIDEAFTQFIASKEAATQSLDPVVALSEGWDDYVRFAADRPRLYAAMLSRILAGAEIPAAKQAFALLIQRLVAIQNAGCLKVNVEVAADLIWASANAASLLHVTAQRRKTKPPGPEILEQMRESTMNSILNNPRKDPQP